MKLKIFLIILLVAGGAAAVFVSLGGLPATAATESQYLTADATVGDVAEEVASTGAVETTATWTLAFGSAPQLASDAAADGTTGSARTWTVAEVSVAVGDTVAAGDVLASAATADLKRELANATLNLKSARVQLRAAEDTLEDAEDDGSTDQVRQAKIGHYNAEVQVAQAETEVRDLKDARGMATLVAPIDGLVTAVNVTAGADAPSGAAITIAATTYEVTAGVVEGDIGSIILGQAATIGIDALDVEMEGTVTAISPVSESSDGAIVSYPVTIRVDDPPAAIRSGMTADVTVTTASVSDVLTVPSEALSGANGAYTVRVLDATGTPQAREVEVGLVTDTLAEVSSGLQAGETVVTGTVSDRVATQPDSGTIRGNFPAGGGALPGGNFGGGPRP